jgi:murein DD-endopeptidase MepM/ murein hydrolase activator NlpD
MGGGASDAVSGIGSDSSDDLDEKTVMEVKPQLAHWLWPIDDVRVTSKFGRRGFDYHEGIDLKAQRGTSVYAADDGRVLYADDRIGGYGKMVVLKHRGGLSTVYAHNSRALVHAGQKVKRGQVIAISGNTGKSSGPHVHFELRVGLKAVDPLLLMPKPERYSKYKTRARSVASN